MSDLVENPQDLFSCDVALMSRDARKKTGLRGFRLGLTQTGMYSHSSRQEA